jgi:hypothetical protein
MIPSQDILTVVGESLRDSIRRRNQHAQQDHEDSSKVVDQVLNSWNIHFSRLPSTSVFLANPALIRSYLRASAGLAILALTGVFVSSLTPGTAACPLLLLFTAFVAVGAYKCVKRAEHLGTFAPSASGYLVKYEPNRPWVNMLAIMGLCLGLFVLTGALYFYDRAHTPKDRSSSRSQSSFHIGRPSDNLHMEAGKTSGENGVPEYPQNRLIPGSKRMWILPWWRFRFGKS